MKARSIELMKDHPAITFWIGIILIEIVLISILDHYKDDIRKAIGITISIEQCDKSKFQAICTTPKEGGR